MYHQLIINENILIDQVPPLSKGGGFREECRLAPQRRRPYFDVQQLIINESSLIDQVPPFSKGWMQGGYRFLHKEEDH